MEQTDTLEATIRRIRFRNQENGYSVLVVDVDGSGEAVVVGNFASIAVGESYQFFGAWGTHPRFGRQFQATHQERIEDSSPDALESFLASGLFPGVGPAMARRIVGEFGMDTLRVLDEEPERLHRIRGMGPRRQDAFFAAWRDYRSSREVLLFLSGIGVSTHLGLKLWQKLGLDTEVRVREDPYLLTGDPVHLAFEDADAAARKLDIARDSPLRMRAGLRHMLTRATWSEGHVFLPRDLLIARTVRMLGLAAEDDDVAGLMLHALDLGSDAGILVMEQGCCYLPQLYRCEEEIANWVRSALEWRTAAAALDLEGTLAALSQASGIRYSEEQHACIVAAAKSPVYVLTGGPGTGKTTTLRGILHLLDAAGERTQLAAPTGRAAKRMSELCGREASTIHRLLEIDPASGIFQRNADRPLELTRLVVDEASMVDAPLMKALLAAMPRGAGIVLIGDRDQLPSVGPGMVLAELLSSPKIPSGRLTHVYRQGEGSAIAREAHRVLRGLAPGADSVGGLWIHPHQGHEEALARTVALVRDDMERRGCTRASAMQVLVPMHKTPIGTFALNRALQEALNPHGLEIHAHGIAFRTGDRIMQLRNNYEWGVFNGDIGTIAALDKHGHKATLQFDSTQVKLDFDDLEQIGLAYACTIHKSQGSEYPSVAIVLDTAHSVMLQRNLLYTALTRAKENAHLLCSPGALEQAARNDRQARRFTRLSKLLEAGDEFLSWMEGD